MTDQNKSPGCTPEVLLDIYRRATLIKQNDMRMRASIRSGKLVSTYYSPRGQEIIPSAVSACLETTDYIVTIYRGIHDQIAKGIPLDLLWAEYAGRITGACKGKGGAMHITHPASGIMVTTGIVGASMPIANGLALASQLKGDGRVSVAYFGDGASNIGAFHESLNMASVWKLPVIFVCQNNLYGEHTPYSMATSVKQVAHRAASYSMPSVTVNGNDAEQTWSAAREAIARARAGEGPTLIEAMTFRFEGHNMGDDNHYIPADVLAAARADDPVVKLRSQVLEVGAASAQQLDDLEADIERQIDAAIEFAMSSPLPGIEELRRDVYAEELAHEYL
ncbi:thiamine pyrophosphate-dependent dehydrogenase E1 component subunit alpha [Pseudomonas sp. NFX224]|uniref:thiamine pyrophosphate-dependent dehydrogenase E1 component subunit alpha n=1 Tax=Pseudomonas sp. NFX224 TaxID=3402862 RepID=UPI003AFA844E